MTSEILIKVKEESPTFVFLEQADGKNKFSIIVGDSRLEITLDNDDLKRLDSLITDYDAERERLRSMGLTVSCASVPPSKE